MSYDSTVFVLGAGFTKAFYPEAPLLTDKYDLASVRHRIEALPTARSILDAEERSFGDGRINIERLLTRARTRMPYDDWRVAEHEFGILAEGILDALLERLHNAASKPIEQTLFKGFAGACVARACDCITFNYDDCFDRALADSTQSGIDGGVRWHPYNGYGLELEPVGRSEGAMRTGYGRFPMLFKLHGSMNWFAVKGARRGKIADAIRFSYWDAEPESGRERSEELLAEIESIPYIVAPVMAKDALIEEPIMEHLWLRAKAALEKAGQVVFIGYSLPETDFAAAALFREALKELSPDHIRVVDKRAAAAADAFCGRYREALGKPVPQDRFCLGGAVPWVRGFLSA